MGICIVALMQLFVPLVRRAGPPHPGRADDRDDRRREHRRGIETAGNRVGRPGACAADEGVCAVAGIGSLPPPLLLGAALFCSSYPMLSGQIADAGRLRLVGTGLVAVGTYWFVSRSYG
jgi:hypothetical protein